MQSEHMILLREFGIGTNFFTATRLGDPSVILAEFGVGELIILPYVVALEKSAWVMWFSSLEKLCSR